MQPCFLVEVLSREAQIDRCGDEVAIGVLVGRPDPECIALPTPDDGTGGVGGNAGGEQMVRVEVDDPFRRSPDVNLRAWCRSFPNIVPNRVYCCVLCY